MKQKMVINVSMSNGKKSYSRALKIVAGFEGVEKASLGEKDKSQIEVVAEGVDPTKIISSLRKKMEKRKLMGFFLGKCRIRTHAELVSVTPLEEKKEEKKEEKQEVKSEPYYMWSTPHNVMPQCIEFRDPHPCAIM